MTTLKAFRTERVKGAMEREKLDVLVASLPEHILYLLGFTILGATYQAKTQNYAVYSPLSSKRYLVISPSDAPTAVEYDPEVEIICQGGFQFDFTSRRDAFAEDLRERIAVRAPSQADGLIEAIRRSCPKSLRIGVDELRTPVTTWKKIEAAFPEAKIVPAMAIFEEIRSVKHPEEIAGIEKATGIAEDSLLRVLARTRLGDSEYGMGSGYRIEVAKSGGHGYVCTCTVDYRTAFSDTRYRRDVRISDGSVIRFDYGAMLDFYRSDLARTVFVGKGNPEAEAAFRWMYEGLLAAEAAMRPGVLACEVYEAAMRTVRRGVPGYARHHCGHGIGLQIYDPLPITPACHRPLEEGMVFCVETPYYRLGEYGVQTEDTVVVTSNGVRRLSHTSCDMIRIL